MLDIKRYFFKNIGVKQTILKNTFWLILAEVATGLLRLVLLIYVARVLGVTEYGRFSFAFSFVSILVIFADLGIINAFTREFSRDKENERKFSALISLEIIISTVVLFLMIAGSFFITNDLVTRRAIWILSIFILITNFLGVFFAFLRSRQIMEYEALAKTFQTVLMFVFSFSILLFFNSIIGLSFGFLLSNLLTIVVFLLFFHFRFHQIKLIYDKSIFKLLRISWPLSLGFMVSWFYMSISSVLLGYFNLITENGWYGASSKVALTIIMPATFIILSFYPALSSLYATSREKLQGVWNFLMQIMIFLATPVLFGGIILAPEIINFLYGAEFLPSIYILQFLIFAVFFNFVNYPYSLILVASDQQKKNFAVMLFGILTNIILNVVLISKYGLYGANLSTFISSFLTLILTIIVAKYFSSISVFSVDLLKKTMVAISSGLLMSVIIYYLSSISNNVIFLIFVGFLVYCLAVYFLLKIFLGIKLSKYLINRDG